MDKIDLEENQSEEQEMNLDDEDKLNFETKNFNEVEVQQDIIKMKISLFLCHYLKNGNDLTEMIKNFEISEFIDEKKDLKFVDLLLKLKDMGFPIEQNMIYYYSPQAEMYVYCGIDPIPEDIVIEKEEYWDKQQLRIKCRESPVSYIHQTMSEEANELIAKNKDQQPQQKEPAVQNKSRRNNEKKIGFIIEKVVEWRKLYNGIKGEDQQVKKLSLDEAAQQVGIPKKSLDDYLLQIRFGRKFGFNFNEYKNDKVGQLRQFVRKHKSQSDKPKKRTNNKNKKKQDEDQQSTSRSQQQF